MIEVAKGNGIKIPSLCYHPKVGPAGRCRVCVVEVEGQKGLQTACTLVARDGMVVLTSTPRVLEARRMVVNLLLSSGEHNCLSCEKSGQCFPCREGANVIKKLLAKVVAGKGAETDLETVLSLTAAIKGTTLCPTGEAFSIPVEAMIKKFRSEFDALIKQ